WERAGRGDAAGRRAGRQSGSAKTYKPSSPGGLLADRAAVTATYCLPSLPRYVIGTAVMLYGTSCDQSSAPLSASKARKRWSLVAPMNTRPPAVTIGPPKPGEPTFCLPSGNVSLIPSGTDHAISPA